MTQLQGASPILWFTAVETAEQVGVPIARLVMIEQKSVKEAQVVALHLDTGKEIRVVEPLARVREILADAGLP